MGNGIRRRFSACALFLNVSVIWERNPGATDLGGPIEFVVGNEEQ